MKINPVKSIIELKQTASPQILFGTEVDDKSSSEQFLLSMYDSVQASIFIVEVLEDGDFCYLALNPTHEKWLGIRSEELRGKKPEDILSPVDAARVRQHYLDCVRFGKTISYQQCLQFQGSPTWWSTTLTPLRDGNSRIYRLIGTSTRIASSKRPEPIAGIDAERERLLEAIATRMRQGQDLDTILQLTVKEIRQVLNSDRVLVYQIQPEGGGLIIAESTIMAGSSLLGQNINDPCFGTTHRERYKRGCMQIVEDIYAAGLHPCLRDFLASLQVRANVVVPIMLKEDLWGLLITHHCQTPRQWLQPEIDLLKQIANQMGIATQLWQLHQQVKHLQTELAREKQQGQNLQGLIVQITEQIRDNYEETQVLQTVTQQLFQLLKLDRCQIELYNHDQSSAQVIREKASSVPNCQGLIRQIADFPEVYQPLLQKQPLQSLEVVPGWHQNLLVVTQMACPIFDATGILGNIWLIRPTEKIFDEREISLVQQIANQCAIAIRKSQLYAKNKAQKEELENRERLKNEFLRTLSQELRTPVTSISLAAQTLESVLTPNSVLDIELVSQLLQILHNECGRESKLISDLLTLTSLKSEAAPPTFISIDLQTWLPPIVESFRQLASCQRQKLILEIEDKLPSLETDITELERIVTELLNHACQCTPEGESITVSAHLKDNMVYLSVVNSGIDIANQELAKIFQPFYRIAKKDPWKSRDTGLELTLVQTMVKHLGGSILAESTGGKITFTMKFPLQQLF